MRETRQKGEKARRQLLLVGYYGEHNLGDDALLEVLLGHMPAGFTAMVTAHDTDLVRQRFRVDTVQRRSLAQVLKALSNCDGLVLGGGSLLQDSTSFRSLLYYAALIFAALRCVLRCSCVARMPAATTPRRCANSSAPMPRDCVGIVLLNSEKEILKKANFEV